LKETADEGTISMEMFTFEDSIKLFPNMANSPQAQFSMSVMLPAKNTEESLFDFLRTQIIKALKGDSVAGDYNKLQLSDVQKSERDSFFNSYKEMLKDEKQDTGEIGLMLNYAQSSDVDIVSNVNNLLTLGFREYAYTGGAHGNYGTRLTTFDLKNKKVMRLDDVLKPNYQKVLNAALNRSARRFFKLKSNESLTGNLFDAEIQANDNFAVTQKGILFNYTPYEIAAYAAGEIQLFVPFDEIKTVVK
jgi:Protein of unknown function (DUF3298)/Deacetylase PdaC